MDICCTFLYVIKINVHSILIVAFEKEYNITYHTLCPLKVMFTMKNFVTCYGELS